MEKKSVLFLSFLACFIFAPEKILSQDRLNFFVGAESMFKLTQSDWQSFQVEFSKQKSTSVELLRSSNELMSENFSKEEVQKALSLIQEAQKIEASLDTNSSKSITNSPSNQQKLSLAISHYKESNQILETSNQVAISLQEQFIDSFGDISENIQRLKRILKSDSSIDYPSLESEYKSGLDLIQSFQYKRGNEELNRLRVNLISVQDKYIKPVYQKQLTLIHNQMEASEDRINLLKSHGKNLDKNSIQGLHSTLIKIKKQYNQTNLDLLNKDYSIVHEKIASLSESVSFVQTELEKFPIEKGDVVVLDKKSDRSKKKSKVKTYQVKNQKPSETLRSISAKKSVYGNPDKWKNIYKANKKKIKHPDKIYPNQIFVIP